MNYSNPRIICEFLTPEPRVRGGLGWGKKFTTHLGLLYLAVNKTDGVVDLVSHSC